MKFFYTLAFFVWLIPEFIFAQATFQKAYGGSQNDALYAADTTWDGKYVMFGSTASSGNGSDDYVLQKTDKKGNLLWAYTYGGSLHEYCSKGISTSDSGFVMVGRTASFGNGGTDVWVIKTDSLGNVQWNKTYGGPLDESLGFAIRETPDGGYIIGAGTVSYSTNQSKGDVYVIKTDKTGNVQWDFIFGDSGDDWITDIKVTSDNTYILVGSMETDASGFHDALILEADASGNILWNSIYGCQNTNEGFYNIIEAYNGGWICAGSSRCFSFNEPDPDAWVIKLSRYGTKIWETALRGNNADGFYSVTKASKGYGYVLGGITKSTGAGMLDALMAQIDTSGNFIWNQTYGGLADDNINMIKAVPEGYIAVGYTSSSGSGNRDEYLIKTDFAGKKNNNCSGGLASASILSNYRNNTHPVISAGVVSTPGIAKKTYAPSLVNAYYSCCPEPTPLITGNSTIDCLNNGPSAAYAVHDNTLAGNTYLWTKKGSITFTNPDNTPQLNADIVNDGGMIKIAETNNCGIGYDSMQISPAASVTITNSILPPDTQCVGIARQIEVDVNNTSANLLYHWTSSDGFTKDTTKGTIKITPHAASTDYYLSITDLHNPSCVNIKDTFTIAAFIKPLLMVDAMAPLDSQCIGVPRKINVVISNDSLHLLYHWSSSDNSFNKVTNEKYVEVSPVEIKTSYYLNITDQHTPSCLNIKDTVIVNAFSRSLIKASIMAPTDTQCIGVSRKISIELNNKDANLLYHWSSSDNSFTQVSSKEYVEVVPVNTKTKYYLSITSQGISGCLAMQDSVEISSFDKQNLEITNLITPNNDNKNDQLILKDINGNKASENTMLEVYNGWGERVYKADNYDNSWQGDQLSDGIYYYFIKSCGDISYKGWIQIVR